MKIAIISYSLTGNNETLAKRIASELNAKHIQVTEKKRHSMGRIFFDMIFNIKPKVMPDSEIIKDYDTIVFVGPVWMGQVASPLRAFLEVLKSHTANYAYLSISGGALNSNPKLPEDLTKRTGYEPVVVIDQHIADLIPHEPKPSMKDTSSYRVTSKEIEIIAENALEKLRKALLCRSIITED